LQKNIGILGGCFNPVHLGHLILAQDAAETFELDKVLFVPCACPPHKPLAVLAASADRLAMLEAALAGSARFEICELEVRKGGTSYSVDTVRTLRRLDPDCVFSFIIGSDTLPELHLWKEIGELLRLCRFVTIARPGYNVAEMTSDSLKLDQQQTHELLSRVAHGHQVGISSSEIRRRVAEGLSINYLTPDAVVKHIMAGRLYRRA
jgi:nicotinate-nucleotide adenylyltransferase